MYVQHLIEEHGASLWELLEGGRGHIYVCGGTKMGADVIKAFEGVAMRAGSKSATAAAAFVGELKASKRYVQELWSTSGQ